MLLIFLPQVRALMISRMAKPEEVLVVENEQGEVVREFMRDTDSINMYKNMRETLVYLTHLDYADTERIMTEKLANQVCLGCVCNVLDKWCDEGICYCCFTSLLVPSYLLPSSNS